MTGMAGVVMASVTSGPPPWALDEGADMLPYRDRTAALLRRYARSSVEVGRLPSLLGRECFRAKVTSYSMKSFEDMVIFVHDMERALRQLDPLQQRLIAMNILEDYSLPEVATLMRCRLRTLERILPDALDDLSRLLLAGGLLEEGAWTRSRWNRCQEGKNFKKTVSDCMDGKNIF